MDEIIMEEAEKEIVVEDIKRVEATAEAIEAKKC